MAIVHDVKAKRLEQRVTEAQRALIERGAEVKNKTLSEFVIESACLAAEMAILDQRTTTVSVDAFDRFAARLDQAPQNNAGLADLFSKRAPWLALLQHVEERND